MRIDRIEKQCNVSSLLCQCVCLHVSCVVALLQAPKDSGDGPRPIPSPTKQTIKMESQNQRQPTPKKASSKLASLKRRDEEQECIKKEEKKVFSPKKEPTHSERAFAPKTGGASTRTGSAITPKTGSAGTPGSSKVSPKKPDVST